jgi:hypothetical protein
MYNLNYAPTALGVQSWSENLSMGARTEKVEYHCSRVWRRVCWTQRYWHYWEMLRLSNPEDGGISCPRNVETTLLKYHIPQTIEFIVMAGSMYRPVNDLPLTAKARVQFQASLCGICGGQSDNGTGSCSISTVFRCQYHSTDTPYSFKHLSLTVWHWQHR